MVHAKKYTSKFVKVMPTQYCRPTLFSGHGVYLIFALTFRRKLGPMARRYSYRASI